jgi:hypothetical protein
MKADLSNVLKTLPLAASTESAYLATRVLKYRSFLQRMSWDSIIAKGGIHNSDEERRTARLLLSTIEREEGKKIQEIDDDIIDQYVDQLLAIIQRRSSSELGPPSSDGEALLNQLREHH